MADTEFDISTPLRHQTSFISPADDAIEVAVNDFNNNTYQATIYFFPFNSDGSRTLDGAPVTLNSGNGFSVRKVLDVDDLDDGFNRFIQVEDQNTNDTQCFSFRAEIGSGSSGSGLRKHFQANFCRPGQLVPVALTLQ